MTPFRKVLACPLAVVLVSACADVNSPTATAPVQPQFSSAVPVPIAGQCDVRYTLDTSVPTRLAMSGTGSPA